MLIQRIGMLILIFAFLLVPGLSQAEDKAVKWTVEMSSERNDEIPIGSMVRIKVQGEEDWFSGKLAANEKIGVYINGILLKKVDLYPVDIEQKTYEFHLAQEAVSEELWRSIRSRSGRDGIFDREVSLAFGSQAAMEPSLSSGQYKLGLIKSGRKWFWSILFIFLLVTFGVLVCKSDIIRDGNKLHAGRRPPVSLAQTQMAIWLFIIVLSYIWIWLITGQLNLLEGTPLILMGISATTYLGASLIENSESAQPDKVVTKQKEIDALSLEIKNAGMDQSKISDLRSKKEQLLAELKNLKRSNTTLKHSSNWVMQLLSDDTGGVKLHRFQNLTWTIVLGLIFITSAFTNLSMPNFSGTLLGVLGISSGTYLGFKFPEAKD